MAEQTSPQSVQLQTVVSRRSNIYVFMAGLAFVALFRSTYMAFGYPPDQDFLNTIEYDFQRYQNYALLACDFIYILLDFRFIYAFLSRTPIKTALIAIVSLLAITESEEFDFSARNFIVVATVTLPIVFFTARFGVKEAQRIIGLFVAACVYVNLAYILVFPQYGIMTGVHAGEFRGMFVHKNSFGPFFAIGLVYLIPFGRIDKAELKPMFFLMTSILALAFVVFSRSAGGLVMAAAIPFVILMIRFVQLINSRWSRRLLTFFSLVIAVSVLTISYLFLFDYFLELIGRDPTLTGRTMLWSTLLEIAAERPFLGHGMAVFLDPVYMRQYAFVFGWGATSPHNSYLTLLLDHGFIVTGLFLSIIFMCLFREISQEDSENKHVHTRNILAIILILCTAFAEGDRFFADSIFSLLCLVSLFAVRGSRPTPQTRSRRTISRPQFQFRGDAP